MPHSASQRPGVLPEISVVGESIVYTLAIAGTRRHEHVTIRCDSSGELWVAIASKSDCLPHPDADPER